MVVFDVRRKTVITRDNVSVKVNAVVYFKVFDPNKAIVEVEDFLYATSQLAQTTLRSVIGEAELDQLLAERDQINERIQGILDEATDSWGIKVSRVEVKHVDLPQEMQRAMARQAEAERERRAKIIVARGVPGLREDRGGRGDHRAASEALQLRYSRRWWKSPRRTNSTTLFPIPIDFLDAFRRSLERSSPDGPRPPRRSIPRTNATGGSCMQLSAIKADVTEVETARPGRQSLPWGRAAEWGYGGGGCALGGQISELIVDGEITGKPGEITIVHTNGRLPARVVVVGSAGKRSATPGTVRKATATPPGLLRHRITRFTPSSRRRRLRRSASSTRNLARRSPRPRCWPDIATTAGRRSNRRRSGGRFATGERRAAVDHGGRVRQP